MSYICWFTVYNSMHILPKIINYSIEKNVFSVFMGFQNANENVFHGFGNVVNWKSFANVL